jgi:hypothetical protein
MKGLMLKNLSLFVVALALSPACFAQANIAGEWQGTLDANGTPFRIAWHVVGAPDGSFTSTIDNIDQSIYGIKVKSTTVKDSDLNLAIDDVIQVNGQGVNVSGTLVGTLNKDATELTATWTQTEPAQPPAPLTMKRQPAQPAPAAAAQPNIAGDWEGTLSAGAAQLRLVMHFVAAKDGSLTATMDSVDQGANGIPVSAVTLKDSKLDLTVNAVHGTYEGTVNKDASGIDGTWSQGQPLPLNFKRATTKPQVAAKPGTPSDIDGTWQGTLETPTSKLRILFKIVNMENGLSATVQSPDQSPMWAPTTSVTRTGDKLSIEMKGFGATFDGKINAAKDTVDGTFTQGGGALPLVLKKG